MSSYTNYKADKGRYRVARRVHPPGNRENRQIPSSPLTNLGNAQLLFHYPMTFSYDVMGRACFLVVKPAIMSTGRTFANFLDYFRLLI